MNEIKKPNDIFVSTLLNGVQDPLTLQANNITAENTGLYEPGFYKDSPLVKRAFSDEKGSFNENAFNLAYLSAASQYQDLVNANTYAKLEKFVEYNTNDIFAPLGAKTFDNSYLINRVKNPMGVSEGVSSIFGKGTSDKSMRELAQLSKIWDSENNRWLDKTADERGIFGSLFGLSLVYATWDSDGEHEDPITGRVIKHRKGEWKLNEDGQYYTETLGNRSGYGKLFVAASDTLTSENSALNKFDFFDSDGLTKSVAGTTFKALAPIMLYMIPVVNEIWGGVTAAIGMAGVLPTFAKAMEGAIVGGDTNDETDFTKAMNRWENYFQRFKPSYADDDQQSSWNYAQITLQVSDIFGQLYQMRAAASISKLFKSDPTNRAIQKFEKEFLPRYISTRGIKGELAADEFRSIAEEVVAQLPDVKKAIETQSKLSKSLSLGYMALTQSSDVYSDALAGGYDRRMAGLAALVAAAGQYGIMSVDPLGTWFLDKATGYSLETNRGLMKKALREYYDDILKAVNKIEGQATQQEKLGALSNLYKKVSKGLRGTFSAVRDGTEPFWKNAIVESVEEVTEEAVMDATKGIFDTLSWLGVGRNSDTASFDVLGDFTSGNFVDRYLQNALGGFMGGALFEFQQNKVEPWIASKLLGREMPNLLPSLIRMIANGLTSELLQMADLLGDVDNEIMATPVEIDGQKAGITAKDGHYTRGLAAASVLKWYIKILLGIIVDENANLTDSQLLEKAIRDNKALKLILDTNISRLLINDFANLSSDIAKIKLELDSRKELKTEAKTDNKEKKENLPESEKAPELTDEEIQDILSFGVNPEDYGKLSDKTLNALLKQKREELKKFTSGKNGEYYVQKALAFLSPDVKESVGYINKAMYTRIKYGKTYSELPKDKGIINKDSIDKEYEEWKNESDIESKFVKLGVETYEDYRKKFQDSIKEHSDEYKDTRAITFAKLFNVGKDPYDEHYGKFGFNELIDDDRGYQFIKNVSTLLRSEGLDGITLQDIFTLDELKLTEAVKRILDDSPEFVSILNKSGLSKSEAIDRISVGIASTLSGISISELEGATLERVVVQSLGDYFDSYFNSLNSEEMTLGQFQEKLIDQGLLVAPITMTEEQAISTDDDAKKSLFDSAVNISVKNKYGIGISSSILSKYVQEQSTLDGEVVKRIAEEALRRTLQDVLKITDNVTPPLKFFSPDFSITKLGLSEDSIKQLYDKVNGEFSARKLEDIVKDWVDSIKESDQYLKADALVEDLIMDGSDAVTFLPGSEILDNSFFDGDVEGEVMPKLRNLLASDLQKKTIKYLTESPIYNLYKSILGKKTIQNPVYETLRNMDVELTDGLTGKAFDILEDQHNKIRSVEKFEDYMPLGKERESLETCLLLIRMYKAIAANMSDAPLSWENPFNYNKQLSDYLKLNKKESDNKYITVDPQSIELVLLDLNLLEEKILGYLNLGDRAMKTNAQKNEEVRKLYSKLMLDLIKEKGSALTISGVSFAPSDKDYLKYEDPSVSLAYISSVIYKKFNESFKTGTEKYNAIRTLVQLLNLNIDEFVKRSERPSDLDDKIKSLNDFDVLNFFTAALSSDHLEFLSKYKKSILDDEKNEQVPLFTQELVMWQAYAYTQDLKNLVNGTGGKVTVHQAFMDALQLPDDTPLIKTPNLLFINGIGGAGKTMVVGSSIAALNSGKLIYVAAPTDALTTKYTESVKKYYIEPDFVQSGNIKSLLRLFLTEKGYQQLKRHIDFLNNTSPLSYDAYLNWCAREIKDSEGKIVKSKENPLFKFRAAKALSGDDVDIIEFNPAYIQDIAFVDLMKSKESFIEKLPEIILIDETTQIDLPYLQVLNAISDIIDTKFIISGDSQQKGKKFTNDSQAFQDLLMFKTSKLNISVRSANNLKSKNNTEFNRKLNVWEELSSNNPSSANQKFKEFLQNNNLEISYFEDNNNFAGDKFVDSLAGLTDTLKKILALSKQSNSKVGIITDLDESGSPINKDLLGNLKDAGYNSDDYVLYSPKDSHPQFVLGAEADYFIVDGNYEWVQSPGENLRSIYTYAGRSLKGSLIVCPTNKLAEVGIRNNKDKRTLIDEVPQLRDRKQYKIKRSTELNTLLEGANYDTEPKAVKTKKNKDDKIYPIRSNVEKASTSVPSAPIKPASVTTVTEDIEETLPEEERRKIVAALCGIPVEDLPESAINMTNSDDEQLGTIIKSDEKDNVAGYASIDHFGIENNVDTNGYIVGKNSGLNFDLDGLTQPGWGINPIVQRGFLKFRNVVSLASNRDEIIEAIRSDNEIATFLKECNFTAYLSQGALRNTSTADSVEERMANWAENNLHFDDNLYVFAKRFQYDVDLPRTIADNSRERSVLDGQPGLFYGIRVYSDDGVINQWITLGALPKRYYQRNGLQFEIGNQELLLIYDAASEQINSETDTELVVYKLPNSSVFDLSAKSLLYFLRVENNEFFETLLQAQQRGLIIDKNNVFLIDSSKVKVNGKEEYKALVYLAGLDSEVLAPILQERITDPKLRMKNILSFDEKLSKLKDRFVKDGRLMIAGQYLSFANFVPETSENSKIFRRAILLLPSANSAKEIFDSLGYIKGATEDLDFRWVAKLYKCRPYSLAGIIADVLRLAGAFRSPELTLLHFVYLKNYILSNYYDSQNIPKARYIETTAQDVDTLILWAYGKVQAREAITQEDAEKQIISLLSRTLLFPFFRAFIGKDAANNYFVFDITSYETHQDGSLLKLDTKGRPTSELGRISLNMDNIRDGYTSLPLIKAFDGNDIETELFEDIFRGSSITIEPVNEDDSLGLYRVGVTAPGFDKSVGFFRYQLQMPRFNITSEMLSGFEEVNANLPQIEKTWEHTLRVIPKKPVGYNPLTYKPKKLSSSDFTVDSEFAKQFTEKTTKKTKSEIKYYRGTDGNWHRLKKPRIRWTLATTYSYKLPASEGKRRLEAYMVDSRGFEVRVGDIVLLYGDSNIGYRVAGIDHKNKLLLIDAIYSQDGKRYQGKLHNNDLQEKVEISAVSAVVHRKIPAKSAMQKDTYYTGKFKKSTVTSSDIPKSVSLQTLEDFILTKDSNFFDFSKNTCILMPFTQLDLDQHTHHNAMSSRREFGNSSVFVSSFEQLDLAIKTFLENPSIVGVTMYRLSENFNKGNATEWYANWVSKANAAEVEAMSTGRGSYISHQVFFTDESFEKYSKDIAAAEERGKDFSIKLFGDSFNSPQLNIDKALGKDDIKGYLEMPESELFNKAKTKDFLKALKDYLWATKTERDGTTYYRFYPRLQFYFLKDDGINLLLTNPKSIREFMLSGISPGTEAEMSKELNEKFKNLLGTQFVKYSPDKSAKTDLEKCLLLSASSTRIVTGFKFVTDSSGRILPTIIYKIAGSDIVESMRFDEFLVGLNSRYRIIGKEESSPAEAPTEISTEENITSIDEEILPINPQGEIILEDEIGDNKLEEKLPVLPDKSEELKHTLLTDYLIDETGIDDSLLKGVTIDVLTGMAKFIDNLIDDYNIPEKYKDLKEAWDNYKDC